MNVDTSSIAEAGDTTCPKVRDRVPVASTLRVAVPARTPQPQPLLFDFDSLSPRISSMPPHSASSKQAMPPTSPYSSPKILSPVFGALTRVKSPVVVRAQWEIVVRGAAWSALIATILMGVVLAIPFRDDLHHRNNW